MPDLDLKLRRVVLACFAKLLLCCFFISGFGVFGFRVQEFGVRVLGLRVRGFRGECGRIASIPVAS